MQLRVASCIYFTSGELRVALIVRVKSCELHLICELRVELKLRVGNSKVRFGPKLRTAYFLFKECDFNRLDGNISTFFDRFRTNFLAGHNFV